MPPNISNCTALVLLLLIVAGGLVLTGPHSVLASSVPLTINPEALFTVPGSEGLRFRDFSAGPTGLCFFFDSYNQNSKAAESLLICTNLQGDIKYQVVLPTVSYTIGHIAMSTSGTVAVARTSSSVSTADIVICSAYGAIVDHYQSNYKVRELRFFGDVLMGMTYDGLYRLRGSLPSDTFTTGGRHDAVRLEVTSFPFTFFPLPSDVVGVFEYTRGSLRFIQADRSVTGFLRPTAPEVDEIPQERLKQGFSVMYTADANEQGRIFAAVSGFVRDEGLRVLEIDGDGSVIRRYRLLLPKTDPRKRFAPLKLRITDRTLFFFSFKTNQTAVYRMPS